MGGAKLFVLVHDHSIGVFRQHDLCHSIAAMAHDDHDGGRVQRLARAHGMHHQRGRGQGVQHFGQVRLHTAALPCCKNDQIH